MTRSLEVSFGDIQTSLARSRPYLTVGLPDRSAHTVLQEGVKATYKKATRVMSDTLTRPTDEGFHEWRKHVKYHWYHCRVLRDVWESVISGRCSELHRLEEYLGEDHDLGVFERFLTEPFEARHPPAHSYDTLLTVIHRRKRMLRIAVRQLGCRLFVESPKDFSTRICAYWKLWIQEPSGTRNM